MNVRARSRSTARRATLHSIESVEPRRLFAAHVFGSATAYATIQAAVDAALAGGTVTVDAGAYAEQVTVTKPLTIVGARAGIDARGNGRASADATTESVVTGAVTGSTHSSAFRVLASDVTIDGFTISGETNPDDTRGAGIVLGPSIAGSHVLNNVVKKNVSGLFLANSSATDPAVIQHNYFGYNNNDGVNGGRGIYTNGTISGGNLTNVTIDANTFVGNGGGSGTTGLEAAMAFEAGTPGRQSAIRITNNTITNNGKAALFFNATNVLIQGNTITGSQDQWSGSLRFEGDNNNVSIVCNNVFDNTGPAVAVDSKGMPGDNFGFSVNYNNFYGNNAAYAVPISVANNFDTYVGAFNAQLNYWGGATGPSGYGPGSGDAVGGGFMQIGTGLGWALEPGGNISYSGWSSTPISLSTSAPSAPSGLTAIGTSPVQMNLSWTDNAVGNATGFIVQRSTDGVTFTQIGTIGNGVTTYSDTTGLAAISAYHYRVLAVNALGTSPASNVATGTTLAPASTTYVSDLAWTSATVGYGTVHKGTTTKGLPITLRGLAYAKGLGTHGVSSITYALNGSYKAFVSDVGVDDETNGNGAVDFQVIGDGKVLFDSGILTGASPAAHINIAVAGVMNLTLVATNGINGSIDYDHADWAGARLLLAPTTLSPAAVPAVPAGVTATAMSASQINLTWTAGDTTQTGFAIDRSTDGGATFTTIATTAATVLSYSNVALIGGTMYTYRVRATNATGSSAASMTATVTTTPLVNIGVTTPLTTLTPTSATLDWGTLQTNASIKGNPLKLRGVTCASGLGTHASSTISYALGGRYAGFTADAGIDDETNGNGTVDFRVFGDGKLLFDSGIVTGVSAVAHLGVNVTGVQTLTLQASPGVAGKIDYDHADWANPQLSAPTPTAVVTMATLVAKPVALAANTVPAVRAAVAVVAPITLSHSAGSKTAVKPGGVRAAHARAALAACTPGSPRNAEIWTASSIVNNAPVRIAADLFQQQDESRKAGIRS